jgi:uncharacterized RDD family membrane protein YckC
MQIEQQHMLADLEFDLVQASTGKRFANYIIDAIVFYILIFCLGIFLGLFAPSAIEAMAVIQQNVFLDWMLSLCLYGAYMFATEAIFKGKTLGKAITGTRAVHEDGSRISVRTALMRGLCRMVPLNALSAFGSPSHPWHDRWTNTYVIDERASSFQ